MNLIVLAVVAAAIVLIGFDRGISVAVSLTAFLTIFYSVGTVFNSRTANLAVRAFAMIIGASALLYMKQSTVLAMSLIGGIVVLGVLLVANLARRN